MPGEVSDDVYNLKVGFGAGVVPPERIMIMKYSLWFLISSLTLTVGSGSGFCDSGSLKPPGVGKSPTDTTILPAATSQSEKAISQVMMDKLSNAVSSEYVIGAEDVLDITVWRNPDLSRQVQVRPDGRISMPIIRDVVAVGKTPTQLAEEMTNKLKEYVQNPVVAVTLKEVNSSNVFLLGEVAHPGKYPLKSKMTLLQGITIAGGSKRRQREIKSLFSGLLKVLRVRSDSRRATTTSCYAAESVIILNSNRVIRSWFRVSRWWSSLVGREHRKGLLWTITREG